MSDSLWPPRLQHARPPCPSTTPGACLSSCPLSWWCHPTISPSIVPFSSCLQSFPASGSFSMSQFFTSDSQSIGVSASASVLPMNIQGWFHLGFVGSRWGIPLVTKVMRKEARHTQRRDRASGVPPDILEHFPQKNQSLPTLLLCALTSDFTGGCPLPPSRSLSVKELTYSSN